MNQHLTSEAEKFEKQKLKFILMKFGWHCNYKTQKVVVDDVERRLCYHQLDEWNRLMADAARQFFSHYLTKLL